MSITTIQRSATAVADQLDDRMHTFAVRHSVSVLRVALAFVFILFGALKFFPGLSPAQAVATEVMTKLTFGLVPADTALLAVAVAEVGVGICLLANRFMRVAVWFLALEMFAILSPIVLLPGELFSGPHNLPSLLGQYILKDFVLLGGVLVLFATQRGARITDVEDRRVPEAALTTVPPAWITSPLTTETVERSLRRVGASPHRREVTPGVVAQAASRLGADARPSSASTVRL